MNRPARSVVDLSDLLHLALGVGALHGSRRLPLDALAAARDARVLARVAKVV